MIPLLVITAWNGTGKTTLPRKSIPGLHARGIHPGLIKHTHHNMDVDKPGKDSCKLRKVGTAQTLAANQQHWALMVEAPGRPELDLVYLAGRMDVATLDLVLIEGFEHKPVAKIVLFRNGCGHGPKELAIGKYVIAIASSVPLAVDVPLSDINDIQQLADFVTQWIKW